MMPTAAGSAALLGLAADIALHTFALVCIFDGVRRMRAIGPSKAAVLSVAFGLVCCIGQAGSSSWTHRFQHDALILLQKDVAIPVLANDWGANFPPKQRAKSSLELARAAFSGNGELRFYFDEAGKRLLYAPSQFDLGQREKKVAALAKLQYAAAESSNAPASWLVAALAAALFGFVWGRGQAAGPLAQK